MVPWRPKDPTCAYCAATFWARSITGKLLGAENICDSERRGGTIPVRAKEGWNCGEWKAAWASIWGNAKTASLSAVGASTKTLCPAS